MTENKVSTGSSAVGFDYAPAFSKGSRLSVTWFHTDVSNRINRPVSENFANALTDPRFVSFVRRIDPANNAADLAAVNALLARPGAVASSSSKLEAGVTGRSGTGGDTRGVIGVTSGSRS